MSFHVARWEGLVTEPGLYLGTPEQRYHEDPCPEPSLSASIAKIALNKSMSKAQAAHPRLRGPDYPEDETAEEPENPPWYQDVGSAVHSLALKAGQEVVEVRAPNWKKKDAQDIRKELRSSRKIPLLTKHYNKAFRMAARLQPVLANLMGTDFAAEAMLCSKSEFGWWMRSLLDGSAVDLRSFCDIKCTALDIEPLKIGSTMNRNDNAFQSSFYMKNADRLDPGGMGRRKFHFIFCEFDYPHEIIVRHPDEALKSLADDEVDLAMRRWDKAMTTGQWPGYGHASLPVGPTNWKMRGEEQRLIDEEIAEL